MNSSYLKASSHRFYGAVTALFMLLLYEILIIWGNTADTIIRNAPEAWLRTFLNLLGISHYYISFTMLTVALVAVPLFYSKEVQIRKAVFIGIILESVFWGLVSGLLINLVIARLFMAAGSMTGSLLGDLGLAIGAGLFEELLFRVILTSALISICLKVIRIKWLSMIVAVLVASLLFSAAHYIGSAGDTFQLYSFLFRFLAGLWFTTLYSIRGFAVVCLTHAFYDIFIILL